jgi:nucleosome binding factor SPN SPT16 subunit
VQLQSIYLNSDPLQEYDLVKIDSVNLESIKKLKSYLEDYKVFLEEIGTVYVAYSGAY